MSIRDNIITACVPEVGYIERQGKKNKYGAWYEGGKFNGYSWCAMYVSWIYNQAGHPLPFIDDAQGFRYCPTMYNRCKAQMTTFPKKGDIVLYDWNVDRSSDHTGIFLKWDTNRTYFWAYEGNTKPENDSDGGRVMLRKRHISCVLNFYNFIDEQPNQILIKGAVGEGVKILQRNLVSRGYHLTADGDFWGNTDNAVRDFQKENGLDIDGEVGPQTKKALHIL